MRAAALLLAVSVTIGAGQTPSRTLSPNAGTPGAIDPPAAVPIAAAPVGDPTSAVIRGRVVRADNGQPIEGARVGSVENGFVVSDAEGRFEWTRLHAGTYTLKASANGFPAIGFGSRGVGDSGRAITLGPGQVVDGIDFALPRGAVLSGVVFDERGEPLPLATVWVLRQRFVNGEGRLVQATETDQASDAVSGADITDDLGRFRIYGLRAGTYYLAGRQPDAGAVPRSATNFTDYDLDAPPLYPTGGSLAEAQPITLAAGQELSGLWFAVRPLTTATITVLLSSSKGPVQGTFAYGHPNGGRSINKTGADGRYSLTRRPPGTYTFFARDAGQVAFARVELHGEDVSVPLTMKPGAVVRGRVVTDEESLTPLPPNVTIVGRLLQPREVVTTPANPDGAFELTGLFGPMYITAAADRGAGWFIKQVLIGGRDVTGLPVDTSRNVDNVRIVITQKVTDLSGTIRDDKGQVAPDAHVFVFPEEPEKRWTGTPYVRAARAGADGRFILRGLLPGRYRAVAVESLESGDETNPALIDQLDYASSPVTLTSGVTSTVALRLVPWP
jgi:hypothetical protein